MSKRSAIYNNAQKYGMEEKKHKKHNTRKVGRLAGVYISAFILQPEILHENFTRLSKNLCIQIQVCFRWINVNVFILSQKCNIVLYIHVLA